MLIKKIYSAALVGLDGELVEVESDVANSLPNIIVVGLPDVAIQESKERVRSAIKNSGLPFPRTRITINLAPADLKKEGNFYDLPIALSILIHTLSEKSSLNIQETDLIVGELGLNGEVRPVKGVLSIAILARAKGFKRLIIPSANLAEAELIRGLSLVGVNSLKEAVDFFTGFKNQAVVKEAAGISSEILKKLSPKNSTVADFSYIRGQEHIKRALEIAAAGAHNIFMIGPPGAGKTLLAKSLVTILPPLTEQEIIDITRLYSIAGKKVGSTTIISERPFRQPHHSASVPALVGGGNNVRPGEISLAHRGVLFLDELGEFPRTVLESLRQPLEEGSISVARVNGLVSYPAQFMLVVAQNPCPCGYYGDPVRECHCTLGQVQKYHRKISGPLLDRIDLHLSVPAVKIDKLAQTSSAESSASVKERVCLARAKQIERFKPINRLANSELTVPEIKDFLKLTTVAQSLLVKAADNLHFSARSYFRIIKIAQTIADLAESDVIQEEHIAEAVQYRPTAFLNV